MSLYEKKINLGGQEFALSAITARDARRINLAKSEDQSSEMIAASLRAGGDESWTAAKVDDLPAYLVFAPLLDAVLELNGLKPTTPGEAVPAAPAV